MAVWFARTTGNINTVNKWNSAADGSGSWLTWPPASGDVLMANGLAITINVNTNLGATGQVRSDTANGATIGGGFTLGNGISLTANVFCGSGNCIFSNSATGFIVGSITGGTAANSYGVNYQGAGTLTITGDVNGGTGNGAWGLFYLGTNTVTITGSLRGTVNNAGAAYNSSTGTINVTGDVIGTTVSGAQAYTAINVGAGTINITGNAIAGVGEACRNNAAGTLTVSGYSQASSTSAALNNIAQGILQVGETRSASNGRGAVLGAFRYASATAAKHMPYTISEGQISMTVLDVAAIVPAESDVRKTVVYGDGAYTGTLPLGRSRTSMAGRF